MGETSGRKAREARYKVMPGYPIEEPFQSIEEVKEYLSGDRITCLLCGKSYKKLLMHTVQIHGVDGDEYKERYHIPWTYGLLTKESSARYSRLMQKRMEEGFIPPMKVGEEHSKMVAKKRRKCPFKGEVGINNLPEHELVQDEKGQWRTKTSILKEHQAKKGTEEYHERMKARPQCQPDVAAETIGKYWKGRKQSPEHIKKRIEKGMETRREKANKKQS